VKEIGLKDAYCHERGSNMTKSTYRNLLLALLTPFTATLGMAADFHFGTIQIAPFENARLTAYCNADSATPCDITFLFVHMTGRVLKQTSMTIQPGNSGFLDLPAVQTGVSGPVEIIPCWKVAQGAVLASLEVFDVFSMRTRILINWGDRSVPRSGDVDFALAGLTPFDTARISAFCPNDQLTPGLLLPASCDVVFEFHDAQGRLLKQARTTLQPGTGGFADLRWQEAGGTGRRVEIVPCWKVTGGAAVGNFSLIDTFSGLTIAHAYPAALASATQ
jgi:hypothetical protein